MRITLFSKYLLGALLSLTIMLFSCLDKKTHLNLKVTVKDNQGNEVPGATVKLNQKTVGLTNTLGVLELKQAMPLGTSISIAINKDSDKYYFAPYFENLLINEKQKQSSHIQATLYFVPKPTAEEQEMVAAEDNTKSDYLNQEESTFKEEELPAAATGQEPSIPTAKLNIDATDNDQEDVATLEDEENEKEPNLQPVATPKTAAVVLNKIIEDNYTQSLFESQYPGGNHDNTGDTVFTLYTFINKTFLPEVAISFGIEENGRLKDACTTNARGRCIVRFKTKPIGPVTFVAKKSGFQTQTRSVNITDKGQFNITLVAGETIDIFAVTKTYNYVKGLDGVEVFVQNRKVGVSDKFGHFSYFYKGKKNDLLEIRLKNNRHLPHDFTTDFVVSGPMNLVRYFTPVNPPPAKLTLLTAQSTGQLTANDAKALNGDINRLIRRAALQHVFNHGAYVEVPYDAFRRKADAEATTEAQMVKTGWSQSDLKATIDGVILPNIIFGNHPVLELTFVDSKGKVLAAAKERLASIQDQESISRAVSIINQKITRVFPFEGSITEKNDDHLMINLGYGSGRNIQIGDQLEVYGIQHDKLGQEQTHKRIGYLSVVEVTDKASKVKVTTVEPRAVINVGDLVVLGGRQDKTDQGIEFRVTSTKLGKPRTVEQANIYFNDHWIGATDGNGRLEVANAVPKQPGILKVIKIGYSDFSREFSFANTRKIELKLIEETAFLRIESEPSGSVVRVDGKPIGKTPLSSPVPIASGFVKLVVSAPAGYKEFSRIMELDQGTMEFVGGQRIILEKDYLGEAERILDRGSPEIAIEKMLAISPTHSDYLHAQHRAGEIYLTMLNRPALAARSFGLVTQDPRVKSFNDKRFIGSHIDEGIALYMTAETLFINEQATAKAHYLKAVEVLRGVAPQLRFVPEDQYAQAVHNVAYYDALSVHKIWLITKDPAYLNEAYRAWRDYLEGSSKSVPLASGSSLRENAEIYYKQAKASIGDNQRKMEKL